ncbi:ABC transporter substrate-binding protein [Microbacterium sp.]|uniref:ABC transporter substrate-binding protein n=1 Tax=Microbacterium sp. TaxID=51671 RepID=UPI003F943C47
MSFHSRRVRFAALGVALVLASTAGCATTGGGEGVDTIRGTWTSDPTTFDPALVTGVDDYRMAQIGYDTVLRRDDDGIIAGIATDYEQTDSGVILEIGDAGTCGDGTVITPTIVADSLQRLAAPETGSAIAPLIFGGEGVAVLADDEAGTVEIQLDAPYSELVVGLTVPAAGIVCPAGLDDPEGLAAGTVDGAWSGPYALSKATPGVDYRFTLREDYDNWADYAEPLVGRPAENLAFSVGADDAVPNQLSTGELDVAIVPHQDLPRFEGDDYTTEFGVLGDYFLIFNQSESSPFADEKVRRAAAQVVDQAAFREAVNPLGELLQSAGDPQLQCVNEDASLLVPQDEEAASPVLEGVTIRLIGPTAIGVNGAGVTYIAERLRAAGATVESDVTDTGTWISTVLSPAQSGEWDATVFASINNVGTLVTGMSRLLGPTAADGGRNLAYAQNPVADEAYAAAMAATDDEAKCAAYADAQAAVLDSVAFVPLSTNVTTYVARDGFSVRHPAGRENLSTLRITE